MSPSAARAAANENVSKPSSECRDGLSKMPRPTYQRHIESCWLWLRSGQGCVPARRLMPGLAALLARLVTLEFEDERGH